MAIDPMLPLIGFGHPDVTGARVADIVNHSPMARLKPDEFAALIRAHIEWSMTEAVMRFRAGDAPMISQDRPQVLRITGEHR